MRALPTAGRSHRGTGVRVWLHPSYVGSRVSVHAGLLFFILLKSNIKRAEVSPAACHCCCWGSSQYLKRNMDCNSNQCPTQGQWGDFFYQYVYFDLYPQPKYLQDVFLLSPLLFYLNHLSAKVAEGADTASHQHSLLSKWRAVICTLHFPLTKCNSLSIRRTMSCKRCVAVLLSICVSPCQSNPSVWQPFSFPPLQLEKSTSGSSSNLTYCYFPKWDWFLLLNTFF